MDQWHQPYHNKVVLEDDEEIRVHVRVKIRPNVTESAAHANVLVDAVVLHALATADVLNLAAQRDVGLKDADADVKYSKQTSTTQQHDILFFIT